MRRVLCGAALLVGLLAPWGGAGAADDPQLRIDVPVTLENPKVVFNLDHLAFEGDEPAGLDFLHLLLAGLRAQGTHGDIVAVFHGAAGYMLLNDAAYNRVRNWQHGNPYKDQIATLQQAGVKFEECGQTMRVNHWLNDDLLPGALVNSGANFRIIQLVQQGFVQIQP